MSENKTSRSMAETPFKNTAIAVSGMTCVSCENKIEKKLRSTPGVLYVKAGYSTSNVQITYNSDLIMLDNMIRIIEDLDYKVMTGKQANRGKGAGNTDQDTDFKKKIQSYSRIAGVGIVLLALYYIISRMGLLDVFNVFPQAEIGMGYGMLFLIGLLTSVHCVAMCGGLNLSQCVPFKATDVKGGTKSASLKPSLLYNSGRVISYTIVGAIVGLIGSVVSFTGPMRGVVQIAAGVFMVIMGLNMLNLFPWLRRFNISMPRIFASKINEQKSSRSPFYVGLLNGLMPCGPLQSMQLYALSTGDPVKGALSMLLFSLGTVPLMFGLGALSSILSKKFTKKMMTVSAALVVILGLFMFNSGISLSGFTLSSIPEKLGITGAGNTLNNSTGNIAKISDGVQTITTTLASGRYEPITVQKGVPVKWIIKADSKNINGCNNRLLIPVFNIEVPLQPGDNIIEFTPTESGTIPYSCWMGMIRSKITVVDK